MSAKKAPAAGLNRDVIKYIAVITMVFNHVANAGLVSNPVLSDIFINIGYFTAITMCWFLVEGFHYTRSVRNYLVRLFVFGLISQAPYMRCFGVSQLNMMFSLSICLLVLLVLDRMQNTPLRIALLFFLVLGSAWSDWGILAPLFCIFFEISRKDKRAQARYYLISALLVVLTTLSSTRGPLTPYLVLNALGSGAAPLLSGVVILRLYNGKRFEKGRAFHKWFFYIFYPAHLTVLCIIKAGIGA